MNSKPNPQLITWWIMWAAFLVSPVQFYFILGRNIGDAARSDLSTAVLGLIPFFISGIIRWVILPKIKNGGTALPVFITGIALAETCCFLGLYVFPAYKLEFFILSILGILQFIPLFAKKYFE